MKSSLQVVIVSFEWKNLIGETWIMLTDAYTEQPCVALTYIHF